MINRRMISMPQVYSLVNICPILAMIARLVKNQNLPGCWMALTVQYNDKKNKKKLIQTSK